MKKLLKINIVLFIIMLLGCDKEVDLLISYPFEIESTFRENTTINVGERTIFEIKPEEVVSINEYQFRYSVTNGDGHYLNTDGEKLDQETWYPLKELLFDFDFVGTEIGEVVVEAEIKDIERSKPITLKYIVENNNFSVELNTISTVATVDERKDFTLILTNTGQDQNVTYEAALFLSQGTGKIELLNNEGEVVKTVDQNETFEIEPGTYNYAVTLDNDGENVLSVTVTDSNNQKNEDFIEFQVNVIDFIFTGSPEKNSTSLGNDININFNIVETDGGGDTYQVRYVLESGNAELYAGPTQIFAGTNTDVPLGDFSWIFRPTEIGKVDLVFIARNGSGVTKEVPISIEVNDRSFDFTATPALTSITLGGQSDINFVITESGGNQVDTYTMTYSSNLNSSLILNGTTYNPGAVIPVPSLEFTAQYVGEQPGKHDVAFTIKAASNSSEVPKDTSIEVKDRTFDFTATRGLATATLGEPVEINYVITEEGGIGQDSYTMVYSSTNNGTLTIGGTTYNPGAVIVVPSLSFSGTYIGTQPGQHTIETTITANSNNDPKAKEVTITYQPSEFTFDVTSDTELTVGDTIPVEFTLNETVGQSTFDISYSVTGTNQEFRNENNIVLSPSTQYDVENNLFNWSLTAIEQGEMTVRYTAINQFGIAEPITIIYTIKPIQFDFTSSPIGTDFLTGEPINFNFDMNAPNTLTYQLSFSSSGDGNVIYNGTPYNEGQNFIVTNSDFSLLHISNTGGFSTITWTITASNGVVKTNQNVITINQKPIPTQAIRSNASPGSCPDFNASFRLRLVWTKDPNSRIVSARLRFLDNRNILDGQVTENFNLSTTDNQSNSFNVCYVPRTLGATKVEVVLTDSNGFQSDPTILTY